MVFARKARSLFAASAVTVASITGLISVMSSSASANTLYPPGCRTGAYGSMEYPTNSNNNPGDWNPNCYVGYGYVLSGNDVAAVQRLVQTNGYGCNSKGIDGGYGANTAAAVACFQNHRGLSPDQVVGAATWQALGFHTLFHPVLSGGYDYYYIFDGASENDFAHRAATNGSWYVINLARTAYAYLNTAGPN